MFDISRACFQAVNVRNDAFNKLAITNITIINITN